jgi:hypothetical protein
MARYGFYLTKEIAFTLLSAMVTIIFVAAAKADSQVQLSQKLLQCRLIVKDSDRLSCLDTALKDALAARGQANSSTISATLAGKATSRSTGRLNSAPMPPDSAPPTTGLSEAALRAAFDRGRTLATQDGLVKFDIAGKPLDRAKDPCSQRLFVRADPLDNFFYAVNAGAGNAKGASVSYTDNRLNSTQTATIDGIVSYVLTDAACLNDPIPLGPYVSGYAVAPWISANGTWNNPKKVGEHSAAKVGLDVQIEGAYTPPFDRQYLSVSPYGQTDFRDEARAGGVDFAWEPVQHLLFLGQGRPINDFIGGFWQLRAEADLQNVENPGITNLIKGNHEWLGGTVRANVFLFPIASEHQWPSWLLNRISLITTAQYFKDAQTDKPIQYYSAALQYKLSSDVSLSAEYDNGTMKETLVKAKQYLVKLNFKL